MPPVLHVNGASGVATGGGDYLLLQAGINHTNGTGDQKPRTTTRAPRMSRSGGRAFAVGASAWGCLWVHGCATAQHAKTAAPGTAREAAPRDEHTGRLRVGGGWCRLWRPMVPYERPVCRRKLAEALRHRPFWLHADVPCLTTAAYPLNGAEGRLTSVRLPPARSGSGGTIGGPIGAPLAPPMAPPQMA
jgi:hypothetical protein